MLIPIRTDRRLHTTPWVNTGLIVTNFLVMVYMSSQGDPTQTNDLLQSENPYLLDPSAPTVLQFITYQFLHADLWHLGGNMLFLWVFGNSVEDRMGKIGYLAFYLAGGILAGLGHAMVEVNPVLGASGSVAAVSGAYLALFPLSRVTLVYWFFFIGTFEIPSMWLILLYFVADAVNFLGSQGGVAYLAHISGYVFGFFVGMTLLWTRLLPREPYDMLSMLEHRKRRAEFRALTRKGFRPWEHHKPGDPPSADGKPQPVDAKQQQIMDLRAAISRDIQSQQLPQAAEQYTKLLDIDAGQVLNQQAQLDIANQLMSQGDYEMSARAYELFLNTYRAYPQREQIELILGLIYARYLNRRQRAIELLKSAVTRLSDPSQKELAHQTLAEITA